MRRSRSRSGWTILVMLIGALAVGWFYSRQLGLHAKPAAPGEKATTQTADTARNSAWKLVVQQVGNAIAQIDAEGKPRPRTWQELGNFGIDHLRKDPWGGRYYLKDGYIRCTGNPQVSAKL